MAEEETSQSKEQDEKMEIISGLNVVEVSEEEAINDFVKVSVFEKSLEELSSKMDDMNKLFIQKIQHTTHEEKIVDQMHTELKRYKEDIYAQLVRPILLDIIEVRDSIQRMAQAYSEKPEGEQSIPNKTFSDYAYDIQDILEKNGVEIYRSREGDNYTPIKQRPIKKVSTALNELHGKIAETISSGYAFNGRTISPEKVNIYYYEEKLETVNDFNSEDEN